MRDPLQCAVFGLAAILLAAPLVRGSTPGPSSGTVSVVTDTLDGGGGRCASGGGDYEIWCSSGQTVVGASTNGSTLGEHGYIAQLRDEPWITAVSPNLGTCSGGQTVTVTGDGFSISGTVALAFGATPADNVIVSDATRLTCRTPSHPVAVVDVGITNPDTQGGLLAGAYTFFADYEADVAPRESCGDGAPTIADWVQVGRFAALLDTVTAGPEFQKADCADKEAKGDGVVSIADWVQAGRYAAALDPVQTAGGPTAPTP